MTKEQQSFFLLLACLALAFLFVRNIHAGDHPLERAQVLSIDNQGVIPSGVSPIGAQVLEVELASGKRLMAVNELTGALEYDSHYQVGDHLLVSLLSKEGQLVGAKAVDHHRTPWLLLLGGLFLAVLVIYAHLTGLRAFLSFVVSLFLLWRFYLPALLAGLSPILATLALLVVLTAVIIFSVVGLTKTGFSAFLGTLVGLGGTFFLTFFFGQVLHLSGYTQPFATALMTQTGLGLSLREIFFSAILIGASGAAMDIAASMAEVLEKKKDISRKELFQSGLTVGRAVIGTMTTTLLLAYTGGFLTLMLLFAARETPLDRLFNLKIVSAELMRTLIGSIGLVLVAPTTAWIASLLMVPGQGEEVLPRKGEDLPLNPSVAEEGKG